MGNLTSSYDYKKPSAKLNDVIGAIMFDDVLDSQERCMSDYHMLLGSELKKMKKIEIKALKDSVYFVPDQLALHTQRDILTKRDLCEKVVSHYGRAVDVVRVIKRVYDTENSGVDSFWARVREENVVMDRANKKIVEVRFCERAASDEVDLAKEVRGFGEFVSLLTLQERNVFLTQFSSIVDGTFAKATAPMLQCGDELFSATDYRALYGSLPMPQNCKRYREISHLADKTSKVVADKTTTSKALTTPFLRRDACERTRTLGVEHLDAKDKALVARIYRESNTRAQKNMADVSALLNDLVRGSRATGYALRHVNARELDALVLRAKRIVSRYYLSTIYDFDRIVGIAKANNKNSRA